MTSKRVYLVFVFIAAFATVAVFMVRQRELRELQAGNETLRQQMETNDGAGREIVAEVSPASSAAQLSPEEKNELLRLRGQVPSLRTEVLNASNRVVRLAESPARTGVSPPSRSAGAQRQPDSFDQFVQTEPYQEANALGRAVQQYLEQHAGKIPDDLAALHTAGNAKVTDAVLSRFELVRSGVIADGPEITPYLLIAREKEARQLPDGKWIRMYIQANGGLTTVGPMANKPNPDDSEFIRMSEARAKQRAEHFKPQP